MEHPPKQGLKQFSFSFNIRTPRVLMEHPPKQGLKHILRPDDRTATMLF